MYKGLLTHSLLCSKFVELTLNKQSAEVTVDLVFILVTIVDGRAVRKNILRAIVYISDIVQLELMNVSLLIVIG